MLEYLAIQSFRTIEVERSQPGALASCIEHRLGLMMKTTSIRPKSYVFSRCMLQRFINEQRMKQAIEENKSIDSYKTEPKTESI